MLSRLSDLVVLSSVCDLAKGIHFDEVIEKFAVVMSRKGKF